MKSKNVIACILTSIMVVCLCSCGSKGSRDNKRTIDKPSSAVSEKAVETHDTVRLPIISNIVFEPDSEKKQNTADKDSDNSTVSSNSDSSSQSLKPNVPSSQTVSTAAPVNEQQQMESSSYIEDAASTQTAQSVDESNDLKDYAHSERVSDKKLIVIDAGHQKNANLEQEPIGPGSFETKMKVSGGTQGKATGKAEYELTLELAFKLQEVLEQRGYEVIQVRTSNDVDISNSERSEAANNAGADAFIRIHANGSEDASKQGAMTICQTQSNPYNGYLYEECKALSEYVLDGLAASTGCVKEYVWETDTMSGINWAKVPVTIVEVGYMSNEQEDILLSDDDYQNKIAAGIADGLDSYFEWRT